MLVCVWVRACMPRTHVPNITQHTTLPWWFRVDTLSVIPAPTMWSVDVLGVLGKWMYSPHVVLPMRCEYIHSGYHLEGVARCEYDMSVPEVYHCMLSHAVTHHA